MKSNASLLYSLCLVVGDFLALVIAFAGAYLIRGQLSSAPVAHPIAASTYLGILILLTPFWILIFAVLGLYNSSIYEKRFVEAGRLAIGSFVGLLFVASYAYASNQVVFPAKLVPVYGFVLAFIFLVLARNFLRSGRAFLFRRNIGITNLLVIGDNKIARELIARLSDNPTSGYRVVGLVSSKSTAAKYHSSMRVFESLEAATKNLRVSDIHAIVQTELYASSETNNQILEFAQTHHIAYRFVPGNSELFIGNIAVELFRGSVPVVAVHQTALIGWGRIVKRLVDVVFGLLLLILTLPFLLMIAILEKIFDPRGPIFYKDPRLTRFGNTIYVYKFRSHKRAFSGLTPEQAFTKLGRPELAVLYRKNGDFLPNDPRVSRIGRFLRRTSLDELPQLFNIVRGDISFVGPRALHPTELEKFAKKNLILAVKSGLTGLAQVSGRRDISFEERRNLDLYYVQNWSLWLDITIMLKTIRVVLRRSGAR